MSDEVQTQEGDFDADFEAGFSGTPSPTATPETQQAAAETPPEQNEQIEQQDQAQQQQQEPKYRQITEDEYNKLSTAAAAVEELKATVGKQFDTAFGKMGGLERMLRQFQEQTPAGQPVEITEDDLAEMREEFPEMVGPQMKALQRIVGKMRGTGAPLDEGRLQQAVNPLLDKVAPNLVARAKLEIAEETLDETHPGWEKVVGVPENGKMPDNDFHRWLATQPEDYRKRVLNSYSPVVIGRSIDKFNEYKESLKKKTDAGRRDRFEQAVTPKGDGGHEPPPDDDAAFDEGYNGR